MSDSEEMKHRIELLRMARELLNEEYINRRAEDHNRWLAECDEAWKNRGIKLPYPPFAPYPSEAEIVAKASSLFNFIKPGEDRVAAPQVAESFISKNEIDAVTNTKFSPVSQSQQETPWEKYLISKPVPEVAEAIAQPPSLGTPWEQILTPKLEPVIPASLEVGPAEPLPESILTVEPVVSKITIDPVDSTATAIVKELPALTDQLIPPTSGIKNLLPSWLQRNQTINKGSA